MLGRFYWIEMSDKELDEKFDKFVMKVDHVTTIEEM